MLSDGRSRPLAQKLPSFYLHRTIPQSGLIIVKMRMTFGLSSGALLKINLIQIFSFVQGQVSSKLFRPLYMIERLVSQYTGE